MALCIRWAFVFFIATFAAIFVSFNLFFNLFLNLSFIFNFNFFCRRTRTYLFYWFSPAKSLATILNFAIVNDFFKSIWPVLVVIACFEATSTAISFHQFLSLLLFLLCVRITNVGHYLRTFTPNFNWFSRATNLAVISIFATFVYFSERYVIKPWSSLFLVDSAWTIICIQIGVITVATLRYRSFDHFLVF